MRAIFLSCSCFSLSSSSLRGETSACAELCLRSMASMSFFASTIFSPISFSALFFSEISVTSLCQNPLLSVVYRCGGQMHQQSFHTCQLVDLLYQVLFSSLNDMFVVFCRWCNCWILLSLSWTLVKRPSSPFMFLLASSNDR